MLDNAPTPVDDAVDLAGALAGSGALSESEIGSGLREALRVATRRTVEEVGVGRRARERVVQVTAAVERGRELGKQ